MAKVMAGNTWKLFSSVWTFAGSMDNRRRRLWSTLWRYWDVSQFWCPNFGVPILVSQFWCPNFLSQFSVPENIGTVCIWSGPKSIVGHLAWEVTSRSSGRLGKQPGVNWTSQDIASQFKIGTCCCPIKNWDSDIDVFPGPIWKIFEGKFFMKMFSPK